MYKISNVNPGDLIAAAYVDSLVAAILDLNNRVTALESITPGAGAKFAIASLSQTSLNVDSPLTVYGINFGSALLNVVSINGTTVPPGNIIATQSNERQLTFTIPPIPNLPSQGANVTLIIQTPSGSDQRTFFLQPQVSTLLTGTVIVSLKQWVDTTDPIPAPGTSILVFNLKAVTNVAATFILTPASNVPGATAILVDGSNNPINPSTIQLQPVASTDPGTDVRIALTLPTGAQGAGTVSLFAASQDNRATGTSGDQGFTINLPPPQAGTVLFKIVKLVPNTAVLSNGELVVPPNTQVGVTISALFPATAPTGTYNIIGPTLPSNAPGWTASLPTGTPTTLVVSAGSPNPVAPSMGFTLSGVSGAAETTVQFGVQFPSGAPFGQVPIRVRTSS